MDYQNTACGHRPMDELQIKLESNIRYQITQLILHELLHIMHGIEGVEK